MVPGPVILVLQTSFQCLNHPWRSVSDLAKCFAGNIPNRAEGMPRRLDHRINAFSDSKMTAKPDDVVTAPPEGISREVDEAENSLEEVSAVQIRFVLDDCDDIAL